MLEFDIVNAIIIFLVGSISNFISATTGGGGLFTIPACIFLGFSPQTAIATARIGSFGANLTGFFVFHQHGKVDYKIGLIGSIFSFIGAILGALVIIYIPPLIFKKVIALTMALILFVIIIKKQVLKENKIESISQNGED